MTCAFTLGLGAVFSLLPHPQQENQSFHATDHTHAKAGVNGGAAGALEAYFVGLLVLLVTSYLSSLFR